MRASLNRHYWLGATEPDANGYLIGSWGKDTRVRPSRDVDLLFLLPSAVYWRFEARTGNRQSQLLQEVKGVLACTYSRTSLRGDGQVVVVPFEDIPVEVSVEFRCQDGNIIVCDTNDEGRYRISTAAAEFASLSATDSSYGGKARALARMLKCWQRVADVPLKSFQLERLSVDFLDSWKNNTKSAFWYDWMIRDFFAYLLQQANGILVMPDSFKVVWLGDRWKSRAEAAYRAAVKACEEEQANREIAAGVWWQEIFGASVPTWVS